MRPLAPILVLLAAACGSVPPLQTAPTTQLVKDPELASRVDALARERQVESEHVGYGGAESASYARFAAVLDKASGQQELVLLKHESPIVRAYVANDIAQRHPRDARALIPLTRDETVVTFMDGCIMGSARIGDRVVQMMCWAEGLEARAALEEIAKDDGHPRAQNARSCLDGR
jgi:hypothetical protein